MIRPVRPDGSIDTGGVFVPITRRRRVLERIASAAMQRVVLIVAPAGYGKSVALRQYLEGSRRAARTIQRLPDSASLLGFLRGFAEAIADVAPDARTTLAGAYEKNASSPSAGNRSRALDALASQVVSRDHRNRRSARRAGRARGHALSLVAHRSYEGTRTVGHRLPFDARTSDRYVAGVRRQRSRDRRTRSEIFGRRSTRCCARVSLGGSRRRAV